MAKKTADTHRAAKKTKHAPATHAATRAAQIYAVGYGAAPNALTVTATGHVTVGLGQVLAPDLTAIVPYMLGDNSYLLTYSSRSRHYDVYKVATGAKSLARTGGGVLEYQKNANYGYTILVPFILGGVQYMVAYEPTGGHFDYFVLDDKTATGVADYNYSVGLENQSQHFTEIDVFNIRYNLFMFAYNTKTGTMIIFQVSVPPIGPKVYTVPYLLATPSWAPGWLRFACFQWGGENFFLKTNIDEHAVNIDHIFDEPLDGTHPVGDNLPLDQTLTQVAPFRHDFALYFLTFQKKDGAITFNRFHSDALGWTAQACNLKTIPKNTTLITPFLMNAPIQPNQKMKPGVKNTAAYLVTF